MINHKAIFEVHSDRAFEALALEIFQYQFENNPIYRSFCDLLCIHPSSVSTILEIPFLPIEFFKSKPVLSTTNPIEKTFTSSGTTGSVVSKHFVSDLEIYHHSFEKGFRHFYGDIKDYTILALLPSYLERDGSSLVYMINHLINSSKNKNSGFYLKDLEQLKNQLFQLENNSKKTLLVGVTFALLDLVETYQFDLKNTIVMETGGMKGKRKELIREELHGILKSGFGVNTIHSEYGMTELLSQAYSIGNGKFRCPPWMKVLIRDPEDALTIQNHSKTGGINIIDLANINSCSFIATQDLGKLNSDGTFEIIGRFDNSDIRGCNLMAL